VREKSDGTRARDARSRFAIRAIARESPAAIER
jgi:hypothetical protein